MRMKYHLIALFTVGVWGMTFVSTKVLLVSLAPLWILLLRFTIGFAILYVLRPRILRLEKPNHELLFVVAGITGVAAYYLLENVALLFSTATAVDVIVAASPLFTALFSAAMGDRSALSARFALGFALAMGGLVVVGTGSGGQAVATGIDGHALIGYGLALLAAAVWAVYSLVVRRIADLGYETVAATKRIFLWGLVGMVPTTLLFGGEAPAWQALLHPGILFNLLFLEAVASAACFVTWGIAVKHLGAVRSSVYIYLVPAITAAASVLLLGEPLNGWIVVGIAMTIGGLALSQGRGGDGRPSGKPLYG